MTSTPKICAFLDGVLVDKFDQLSVSLVDNPRGYVYCVGENFTASGRNAAQSLLRQFEYVRSCDALGLKMLRGAASQQEWDDAREAVKARFPEEPV